MITDDGCHHGSLSASCSMVLKNAAGEQSFLLFLKEIQNYKSDRDLWRSTARSIRGLLHVTGGGIMLLDRDKEEFFTPAASLDDALIQPLFESSVFSSGKSPLENLFSTGDASVVDFSEEIPEPFGNMGPQLRKLINTRLDVPLRLGDTMVGTLWAINPVRGAFDAQAALLMNALAGITGLAVERIHWVAGRLGLSDQQIKHFNMARDQAVDHLSHAIKTPLAVSIASLKLLKKQLCRLPEVAWKRTYDRTERNLKRLLNIEYELEDILRNHQQADQELHSANSDERL
jgi:GAF domain-containing protein